MTRIIKLPAAVVHPLQESSTFPLGVSRRVDGLVDLRGASWSRDAVRTASESKQKPPTSSEDGHDARRWREGTAGRRDRTIFLRNVSVSIASRAYPTMTISRGSSFFRHSAKRVGKVFFVARLPSAPKRTMLENCGWSLVAVRGSGGASRASSSLTLSRNLCISLSLSVGSVVTSGGGGGALLVLLMVVQRCVRLSVAAKRCGCCVHLLRAPLRLFSHGYQHCWAALQSPPLFRFACLLVS